MLAKKTKNLTDQIRYFRNEAAHYNSNINLLRKSDFHDLGYLILKLQAADDNLSKFIIKIVLKRIFIIIFVLGLKIFWPIG